MSHHPRHLLFCLAVAFVPAASAPAARDLDPRQETGKPTGGFYSSGCGPDWTLNFGGYPQFMAAVCPDAAGVPHASFISLMDCLTNSEGRLEGKKGGAAMFTCTGCVREGNSNITCSCRKSVGPAVSSTLDLDTVIKNVDGILSCYDYPGVEVRSLNNPPA